MIEAHINARHTNSPLDGVRIIGYTIPAETIVAMIEEAIEFENWSLAVAWLEALGRRDDLDDLEFLIRMAGYPPTTDTTDRQDQPGSSRIRIGALRAIARQLLIEPELSLDRINRLNPQDAKALMRDMVNATRLIPRLGRPGQRGHSNFSRHRVDRKRLRSALSRSELFILTHQDALLKWIGRIDDPFVLGPTYALMDSPEATARLSNLVRRGNPQAIESAWVLERRLDPRVLHEALQSSELSGWDRTMVDLILSEGGGRKAYASLEAQFEAAPPFPDSAFRDPTGIAREIARRENWQLVAETTQRLVEGYSQLADVDRDVCDRIITTCLAELLRNRPRLVIPSMTDALPSAVLVQAVISAESTNSEELLNKIESRTTEDTTGEWPALSGWWVSALRATGTEWSRDTLANHSEELRSDAFLALAWLGDDRALELCPSKNIRQRQQLAFLLARPDKAPESDPGFQSRSFFSKPSALGRFALPPPNEWPEGRIDEMIDSLLLHLSIAEPRRRLFLISKLRPEVEFWPDRLLDKLLLDDFGPVRLSALLYLLQHPRPELSSRIRRLLESDPYPWCRRVAREIMIFDPDPLIPGTGIEFF
jgi:hypothetical protein